MHPYHDLAPQLHYRQLVAAAEAHRVATAERRRARAQRLRRRADDLEQRAHQAARRTFT